MSQFDNWFDAEKWMDSNCFNCQKWEFDPEKDTCAVGMKLLLQIELSKNEGQEYFNGPANKNAKCNLFTRRENATNT